MLQQAHKLEITAALSIIQRILCDSWLIEERPVLINSFPKYFSCTAEEMNALCAHFFQPDLFALISIQSEQAQQKRLSIQQRRISDKDFFHSSILRYGAEFALNIVQILVEILQSQKKDWRKILRSFDQLVSLGVEPLLVMALYQKTGLMHTESVLKNVLFNTGILTIGRSSVCDIVLLDPLVEELHATLNKEKGQWIIESQSEHRQVWVNGKAVRRFPLECNKSIFIGPIELWIEDQSVHLKSHRKLSVLSIQNLNRKIADVTLLNAISFSAFSGELIAMVGPSGAGKTTLLNAINAIAPADSGKVMLNEHDFHSMLSQDRSLIGIVPQDDLVLPELSVEESLYYSGCLRLPPSTSTQDLFKQVDRVLEELDILHIRKQRIGDALNRGISGGQRKRVNLGQELISQSTKILFLDEPTSGLDPRASQDIVRLTRALADKGRIIFLVTHDLTDQIMKQSDRLLVLERGGQLAFFGSQREALSFFQVDSTDEIFRKLGTQNSEWPPKFQKTPFYEAREKAISSLDLISDKPIVRQRANPIHTFWRHLSTLCVRYAKVKMRDRTGVLVSCLQPALLVLVMSIVFRHQGETEVLFVPTQTMIFMMSLSCMWFGMSASVRELITDQVIFLRERRIGVGVLPYMLSKTIVLSVITCIQVVLMTGTLYWIFSLNTYGFSLTVLWGVSTLTAWLGMSVGLCVSALWKSSEAAIGTIPLILIPQIAFSTIMYGLRDMTEGAKFCTALIFQRYTFDAFLKSGKEIAIRSYQGDYIHQPLSGTLWKLGLKTTDKAADMGYSLNSLVLILSGTTIVLLILCFIAVWLRGKRSS